MGKRIGIIIHSGANLFSNGITQNAWFIYECLTLCGYTCEFLCHEREVKPFAFKNILLRSLSYEIPYHEYLLIISVTKNLLPWQYLDFHRNGVPVVSFICGNHFMIDMERFVHSKDESEYKYWKASDVIWIIPSFYYAAAYLETLRRTPVFEIPHLWSPQLLEHRALTMSKVEPRALYFKENKYTTFDIIILEPNMNIVKNALFGLTIAEFIYKRWPSMIRRVYLGNVPSNQFAKEFLQNLSVPVYQQKGYKEMDEILLSINSSDAMPIFLCNQFYHSLNYLYYECLYYGYPLVHNSESLDGCGYYYSGYSVEEGAKAVLDAFKNHPKNVDSYMSKGRDYLERVNPYSKNMQGIWTQAISSLVT